MADRPVVQTPLDRYVVLEYLAEGGMGAIYLGKKLGAGGFEKEVVLKQLLPEFTQQPEFIDLFLREARLSATLDHANIVHTIDLVNAGDEYFIVMEYVRGGDLRTLLKRAKRRRRRIPPGAAIFVARELLSALAYAHSKVGTDGRPLGLIHRDVSPSNILVSGNGEVKLTDFGIAKASTHRSIFYRVKGKVGYMSPEQARGETLDPRSDLYSVAVCLYEMLTGERLFVAASLTTSADELYSQPVPAVSRKRQDLPRELDKVMFKALAVDPKMRYQSAGEFQEALLRVAHRNGLMSGAPELARALVEACGPVEEWSSPSVKEPTREGTEAYFVAGTEKIALSDLEEAEREGSHTAAIEDVSAASPSALVGASDVDEISDLDAYLIEEEEPEEEWARDARHASGQPRLQGAGAPLGGSERGHTKIRMVTRRPSVNAPRLTGLELTSLIRADERTQLGSKPLVDLDDFGESEAASGPGSTASSPRSIASSPRSSHSSPPRPRAAAPSAASTPSVASGKPRRASTAGQMLPTDKVAPVPASRSIAVWLVVPLLLVAGAGVAVAIALSSPDIEPLTPAPRPRPAPTAPDPPPRAGKLAIESEPSGAHVLVEKRARCRTPCTLDDLSAVSTTVIRLELEGHFPWSALVDLGGKPGLARRTAKLRKRPPAGAKWGAVLIRANSPADVLVDGKEIGHVTTEGPLELPAGTAELTLVAASGARRQVKAVIKAAETISLDVAVR